MDGVRCMVMRGGTSKGAYFLRDDLPADTAERDELLMRIMGTPDARQIDGIGGAHPLTSKVAVVVAVRRRRRRCRLPVPPGRRRPADRDRPPELRQPARRRRPVRDRARPRSRPAAPKATVRIHMINTDSVAVATFPRRRRDARVLGRHGDRRRAGHGGARSGSTSPTSPVGRAARCCRPATPSTRSPASR